jgi:uncharacterized iron-regulated protein
VAHHEHQIAFLTELKNQNNHQTGIAVGMEFFSYPHQPQVNLYLQNQLAENDFLKAIGWGNNPFDFYRHQVLFPRQAGGWTQALNAPPWLSRKIAKEGLLSLTEEEKTFLPPQFQLGRPLYYQRFVDAMGGGHIPEEAMQRYFVAQSLWDDTMAWQAANYLSHNPDHVLVIIVGDFHATYGGGLPDRLNARGIHKVLTVSQTTLQDYTPEERERLLEPDVKYGQRADFLWTTEGNSSKSLPGQRPYQSIVRRLLWQ